MVLSMLKKNFLAFSVCMMTFFVFALAFCQTTFFPEKGHMYFLFLIFPLSSVSASFFLSRKRLIFSFFCYQILFSSLHFLMYKSVFGFMDLLWIAFWVLLPSWIGWGIGSTAVVEAEEGD